MNENTIHGILAIVSVIAIAALTYVDIQHGGDGAALSAGLGTIGLIGGYGIGKVANTSGNSGTPPGAQ